MTPSSANVGTSASLESTKGQAAFTKEKSGKQVERNRRYFPAPSEPSDDPQTENEQPKLEENRADFLTRGGGRHIEGVDLVHRPLASQWNFVRCARGPLHEHRRGNLEKPPPEVA